MPKKENPLDNIFRAARMGLVKKTKPELISLHKKALRWFDPEREWGDERKCPPTKAGLVEFFLSLDPVLADGGMMDFLHHNKVVSERYGK